MNFVGVVRKACYQAEGRLAMAAVVTVMVEEILLVVEKKWAVEEVVVKMVAVMILVGVMLMVGVLLVVVLALVVVVEVENSMVGKAENLLEKVIQKTLVEFPTKFIIKRCRTNPTVPPNNESPLFRFWRRAGRLSKG